MPGSPADSGLRSRVNASSHGALTRLSRLPRWVVPLITVALLLVGLAAPPTYAVIALALIGIFLLWLAYLSWPVLQPGARTIRVVVIALIGLCALARVYGWL